MVDEAEVPEGAAVFPEIPPEVGVSPLLLAVLHVTVFLGGSDEDVVNPAASGEVLEAIGSYLRRLKGDELEAVRADLDCLAQYARGEKWAKGEVQFLKEFLTDFGVEGESA
jgi:hypothetical protein